MSPECDFTTLYDYFEQKLAQLPSQARLALVLDPPGLLRLGEAIEIEGQSWIVFRYDGNDLAFRKAYTGHGPDTPHLVWVTQSPGRFSSSPPGLDLSFLVDVIRRADAILDLSLLGVLRALKPRETWPPEAVARFEPFLAAHLGAVVTAHADLRRAVGAGVPLDTHCLRALVLHALHPAIPVGDLTFRDPDPRYVLTRYLRLLVEEEWDEEGLALLQEQALLAPGPAVQDLTPWFEAPPVGLVHYLYLRRLLARRRVANIAAIVRGMLPFDPRPLEPWVDTGLRLWDQDLTWRDSLIVRAERALDDADLDESLALLEADNPEHLFAALASAETPAVAYGLGRRLLARVTDADPD